MKFIVFAEDWGAHPSSTQHLFTELAKTNEIHWVNSIGMRKPTFNKHDVKRVFNKLGQLFKRDKHQPSIVQPETMTVYNLPVLPWHDNALVRYFNKKVFKRYVNPNTDNEPVVYWLSVATAQYMINKGINDKLIYYCGDDFTALAGVDASLVAPFERALINDADLIYVISDLLAQKMPKEKTQLLTHGVSYSLFSEPALKAEALAAINAPIIGFYGSLNAWLDTELLINLAKQRPHYNLVLVGSVVTPLNELLALANVIHINAVEHSQLVTFSAHWDVALLPFIDNEQIRACDPLKLKEYLAVGKPIVATDFPAVRKHQSMIQIASDQQQFIDNVDRALGYTATELMQLKHAQQMMAKAHSWQSKATRVERDIANV
jgi:glycosyltransferase involved in cell wall biosynthesis